MKKPEWLDKDDIFIIAWYLSLAAFTMTIDIRIGLVVLIIGQIGLFATGAYGDIYNQYKNYHDLQESESP